MMTAREFYHIISFIVPLYIFMFIGYASVKWWKLFNQKQCSGISRFCSLFAVPVLSFDYISRTNLYEMNIKFLGADVLQKMIVLVVVACWYKLGSGGSIEWVITIFSVCTLPNALILGVPIIRSMYHATPLVVEVFVAQSVIWHTLLLIMYEYREARIAISQQFDDIHGCDAEINGTTAVGTQEVVGGISSIDTRSEVFKAIGATHVGGGEGHDLEIHVQPEGHETDRNKPSTRIQQGEIEEVPSTSKTEVIPEIEYEHVSIKPTAMPSRSVMIKQIMIIVWSRVNKNPNTYATILGLIWAYISSMFHIEMPLIGSRSVTFLATASLGMGMFNMGLSMGLQAMLVPCGKMVAALTMALRFIIGPMVMAIASLIVGLRGITFRIAVVQAAVSQGVAPSIFAVEYNIYPEIISLGMTLGIVVALPVTLLYYNLFEIEG